LFLKKAGKCLEEFVFFGQNMLLELNISLLQPLKLNTNAKPIDSISVKAQRSFLRTMAIF